MILVGIDVDHFGRFVGQAVIRTAQADVDAAAIGIDGHTTGVFEFARNGNGRRLGVAFQIDGHDAAAAGVEGDIGIGRGATG